VCVLRAVATGGRCFRMAASRLEGKRYMVGCLGSEPEIPCSHGLRVSTTGGGGGVMRSSPLWDLTQRRLVVIYRRFGTTYPSHLQGSGSQTA
jgi:hypothetical protein